MPVEPGGEILNPDADRLARAAFGADPVMELKQRIASGDAGGALAELVGRADAIEHFERGRDQSGVRDPGSVVAVARLAFLVGDDARDRGGVGGFVALDRDRRRHAAHREGAATVAGVDQP